MMFSYDNISKKEGIFKEMAQIILDYAIDQNDKEKYFKDLKTAKDLYKEKNK